MEFLYSESIKAAKEKMSQGWEVVGYPVKGKARLR